MCIKDNTIAAFLENEILKKRKFKEKVNQAIFRYYNHRPRSIFIVCNRQKYPPSLTAHLLHVLIEGMPPDISVTTVFSSLCLMLQA